MRGLAALAIVAATDAAAEPADPARGAKVFEDYCAVCHGVEARGDGPMAGVLLIPPTDLTALAAGNDGTFPAAVVATQIDGRSPMAAHGGDMPIFGRVFRFPDGSVASETGQPIITAQPIADVIAWLATVQD